MVDFSHYKKYFNIVVYIWRKDPKSLWSLVVSFRKIARTRACWTVEKKDFLLLWEKIVGDFNILRKHSFAITFFKVARTSQENYETQWFWDNSAILDKLRTWNRDICDSDWQWLSEKWINKKKEFNLGHHLLLPMSRRSEIDFLWRKMYIFWEISCMEKLRHS